MVKRKYLRRHYIVNRNFQNRFIAKAMGITVLSFFMAFVAILLYLYLGYGLNDSSGNKIFVQVSHGVKVENIVSPLQMILPPLIIGGIIVFVVVFISSLIYSNRIAGPVYRFKMILEMYKNGNYNVDVILRKHDEFKDLADCFNRYSRKMRK